MYDTLFGRIGDRLSPSHAEAAIDLLVSYEDCFVGASGKVGWTNQATHTIETDINRPVKQPPRRTSYEEKDQIEQQLSELLLGQRSRQVSRHGLLLSC